MAKRWKKEQVTYLKRYGKSKTVAELAERFRTNDEEVVAKLVESGVTSKDGYGYQEPFIDPTLADFEKGLKLIHAGKFAEGKKLFAKVAAESEQVDLAARARSYLVTVQRRTAGQTGTEDPYLEAVLAKNDGDLEGALDACSRGGRRSKDERFAYLAASIRALQGETGEALELLGLAIELNPKNRVHAFHDPDFESLHNEPQFVELFESR